MGSFRSLLLKLDIMSEECWPVFMDGVNTCLALDAPGVVRKVGYYKPCALSVLSKVLGYGIILGS